MSGAHNVFISHRHEDDALVEELKRLMSHACCILRNSSIMASDPTGASSENAIKSILAERISRSGKILVIIEPETRYHEWVDWEIKHAHQYSSKRIIGVWAPGADRCALPDALQRHAHAVVEWNADEIMAALDGANNWHLPDAQGASAPRKPAGRSDRRASVPGLFSYVVGHDVGLAPNPFHGWCTLAIGAPGIRRRARPGDWIIGTGSWRRGGTGSLVYGMRVDEVVTHDQYWNDPRFTLKKPDLQGTYQRVWGDNIYHRVHDGPWIQEPSMRSCADGPLHEACIKLDTRVNAVLVSQSFVYYGEAGPRVPDRFRSAHGVDVVHHRPGYKCRFPESLVHGVVEWVRSLEHGIQGRPAHW